MTAGCRSAGETAPTTALLGFISSPDSPAWMCAKFSVRVSAGPAAPLAPLLKVVPRLVEVPQVRPGCRHARDLLHPTHELSRGIAIQETWHQLQSKKNGNVA